MKPVVQLQYKPSVLTLPDPCNLHDSDDAGAGIPHAYTYNLLSATTFYRIFCEDCQITHVIPMDVICTCHLGLCNEASQLC
jgi:hypothetical protein